MFIDFREWRRGKSGRQKTKQKHNAHRNIPQLPPVNAPTGIQCVWSHPARLVTP